MSEGFIDNFSCHSKEYSFSRPTYPDLLFDFLYAITPQKNLAWDCATGNGQSAIGLCKYFKNVIASDANKNQIQHGFQRENIDYKIFPAGKCEVGQRFCRPRDCSQAIHWFDFEKFYTNVKRVGKKNGIIAVWSYDMHKINPQIDNISNRLNVEGEILGNYWAKETKYVNEKYKTIPFPFKEISVPTFKQHCPGIYFNYGIICKLGLQ